MARPESLAMIERFVSIDTVSRNANLELIEFARAFLHGCGAAVSITHSDDGRKRTLLAPIGPRDRPGIVLSGHTDVVPVDGQTWTSDPFAPVVRQGAIH